MARRTRNTKGNRRREPRRTLAELARDWASSARAGAGRVLTAVCAVGIALGVPLASLKVYTYVVSSERFAVRAIEIQGVQLADRAALLERAHIAPGINVFDVDEQAAARAIEADPWIARAAVTRELPDTIAIAVTERRPSALVLDAPNFVLVEHDGSPIKALAPEDTLGGAIQELALVTGLSAEALGQGGERGRRAREKFEAALHAQRALEQLQLEGLGVAEAHVDEIMGVTLVLDPYGLTVAFSR
ncbi:MAG: FtsQ-type POTRA domain-containing protein [Myxococcota bacterium]